MKGCRPRLSTVDAWWRLAPGPPGCEVRIEDTDGRPVACATSASLAQHIIRLHNATLLDPRPAPAEPAGDHGAGRSD